MLAVLHRNHSSESLYLGTVHDPVPGPHEVRLQVAPTALNRADIMQRRGVFPPPPGASNILGLEAS